MNVDLLIQNVQVFNSYLKKFIPSDVAILGNKFLYIGKKESHKLNPKKILDGNEKYLIPGLIDIHMHIESSMATPVPFSHHLAKNGVTTIVSEPHEIANVFGIRGIQEMIHAAEECVIDVLYGVPSSVPSSSMELETVGEEIGLRELQELMKEEKIVCLGEVMNYRDVIYDSNSKSNQLIQYVQKHCPHHPVEGHCPKLMGLDLAKYIFSGIDSDHTEHSVEEIRERILDGMFVQIQEKTLTKKMVDFLVKNKLFEHFSLVTDDVMADSLMKEGHLNKLVKKAIELGMTPEMAIYVATFTPARRMNLRDKGSIAPGKRADFLLLDDLYTFSISHTFKDGEEIYNKDKQYPSINRDYSFPAEFYKSVQRSFIEEKDLQINVGKGKQKVKCRIMKIRDKSTFTEEIFDQLDVVDGLVDWENSPHCLIAVLERHGKNGNIGLGLVTGDTIKRGAVATTYAHDHHNLLVIGKNPSDMINAANMVIKTQGGYCVVENEDVIAKLDLPVAGILSEQPIEKIGTDLAKVRKAMKDLGYRHYNPIMSLSTNSLPVSPELKITDKGLIKVSEGKIVDVVAE